MACLRWIFRDLFAHRLIVSIEFSLIPCLGVKTSVSSKPDGPGHRYEESDPDIFWIQFLTASVFLFLFLFL
jgi:hypothetical protein